MTWTASIFDKRIINGELQITVEFTNDGGDVLREIFKTRFNQNNGWLKAKVIERVNQLNGIETTLAGVSLGLIDLTPDVIPNPTAEEIAKKTYAQKLNSYLRLNKAVELGIVANDNATYLSLRDYLKNNFQTDYLDLYANFGI